MNLLSLINPKLDIIYEVTMKCVTVPKSTTFHELNGALMSGATILSCVVLTIQLLSPRSSMHAFYNTCLF